MEVTNSFIADAANLSADGKLNVIGVFENIAATNFPILHGALSLIFGLGVAPDDIQAEWRISVRLITEDGNTILGPIQFNFVPPQLGPHRGTIWQVLNLQNVPFPEPGAYEFLVEIDGRAAKAIPLNMIKRPE